MPSTAQTLDGDGTDWTAAVRALGARTDNAGAAVTDLAADEDRLINHVLTEGFLTADAFVVSDGASGMEVTVGSGTAKADIYVVEGDDVGQHPYLVRMDDADVTITLDAGDADPRIDEIWLVVADATYDGGSVTEGQLVYRKGDAATNPDPPGADASWDAAVLLASIAVAASASTVAAADITDERAASELHSGSGTAWTDGNDGPGSGLDADLLDGVQLASALNSLVAVGGARDATSTDHVSQRSVTGTVDIPADWNSYIVLQWGTHRALRSGSQVLVVTRLRFNGNDITAGDSQGYEHHVDDATRKTISCHGFTTESATGTLNVGIIIDPSGTISGDNVDVRCLCLRTS